MLNASVEVWNTPNGVMTVARPTLQLHPLLFSMDVIELHDSSLKELLASGFRFRRQRCCVFSHQGRANNGLPSSYFEMDPPALGLARHVFEH